MVIVNKRKMSAERSEREREREGEKGASQRGRLNKNVEVTF